MAICRCFALIIPLAISVAPVKAAVPEDLGYEQTVLGREDTLSAIDKANSILQGRASHQLSAGWVNSGTGNKNFIRVWLVALPGQIGSTGTPDSSLMEVPNSSCKCIIARTRDIRAWISRAQTVNGSSGLEIDVPVLMTFMLLHETGHIASGHLGPIEAPSGDNVLSPAQRLTIEQCHEVEADAFAARLIRRASNEVGKPGWLNAGFTAMELPKLSFNLFGKRIIEHYPDNFLGLKAVFGDNSYTHPNFDLRLYAINADISDDVASKQLRERARP
jgi:hypothetical protein